MSGPSPMLINVYGVFNEEALDRQLCLKTSLLRKRAGAPSLDHETADFSPPKNAPEVSPVDFQSARVEFRAGGPLHGHPFDRVSATSWRFLKASSKYFHPRDHRSGFASCAIGFDGSKLRLQRDIKEQGRMKYRV